MAKGCTVNLEESFTNVNVAGSIIAALVSGATTLVGAAELGANEQGFVSATSPVVGGYNVQAGTGVTAAGSTWVSFPKAFVAAPTVVIQQIESAEDVPAYTTAGSVDTGSFIATGSAAAAGSFAWIAIGSGTF